MSDKYSLELWPQMEEEIEKVLGNQPWGGMIKTSDSPWFNLMTPFMNYIGKNWGACRKQVDHLDQVTCWRIKK